MSDTETLPMDGVGHNPFYDEQILRLLMNSLPPEWTERQKEYQARLQYADIRQFMVPRGAQDSADDIIFQPQKHQGGHVMSHANTHPTAPAHPAAHATPAAKPAAAAPKAAAARDATADALKLLLLLSSDWLNGDRTHSAEIASLTASLTAAAAPPVNVDVPYVSQTGATLSCTMGNWHGEPTSYAYAWHSDGVANAATGATYPVGPDDSGHSLACVVTATNAVGSTAAPMSNAVTVA